MIRTRTRTGAVVSLVLAGTEEGKKIMFLIESAGVLPKKHKTRVKRVAMVTGRLPLRLL